MKRFTDVEELVSYMYKKVDDNLQISVISNKELTISILREFLDYDNTEIAFIDMEYDYDKEYFVELNYDKDEQKYSVSVDRAYDYETKRYLSVDDIILFHEDVNSKALNDMQSNKFVCIKECDWFTFDDEVDESEDDGASDEEDSENKYFLNGKPVTKEEYERAYDSVQKVFKRVALEYCEFMDEMNEWRKLLRW